MTTTEEARRYLVLGVDRCVEPGTAAGMYNHTLAVVTYTMDDPIGVRVLTSFEWTNTSRYASSPPPHRLTRIMVGTILWMVHDGNGHYRCVSLPPS